MPLSLVLPRYLFDSSSGLVFSPSKQLECYSPALFEKVMVGNGIASNSNVRQLKFLLYYHSYTYSREGGRTFAHMHHSYSVSFTEINSSWKKIIIFLTMLKHILSHWTKTNVQTIFATLSKLKIFSYLKLYSNFDFFCCIIMFSRQRNQTTPVANQLLLSFSVWLKSIKFSEDKF